MWVAAEGGQESGWVHVTAVCAACLLRSSMQACSGA
jgi:hypothetical protein